MYPVDDHLITVFFILCVILAILSLAYGRKSAFAFFASYASYFAGVLNGRAQGE